MIPGPDRMKGEPRSLDPGTRSIDDRTPRSRYPDLIRSIPGDRDLGDRGSRPWSSLLDAREGVLEKGSRHSYRSFPAPHRTKLRRRDDEFSLLIVQRRGSTDRSRVLIESGPEIDESISRSRRIRIGRSKERSSVLEGSGAGDRRLDPRFPRDQERRSTSRSSVPERAGAGIDVSIFASGTYEDRRSTSRSPLPERSGVADRGLDPRFPGHLDRASSLRVTRSLPRRSRGGTSRAPSPCTS